MCVPARNCGPASRCTLVKLPRSWPGIYTDTDSYAREYSDAEEETNQLVGEFHAPRPGRALLSGVLVSCGASWRRMFIYDRSPRIRISLRISEKTGRVAKIKKKLIYYFSPRRENDHENRSLSREERCKHFRRCKITKLKDEK